MSAKPDSLELGTLPIQPFLHVAVWTRPAGAAERPAWRAHPRCRLRDRAAYVRDHAVGAEVVGIDSSPEMIATARRNFPQLRFEVADVTRSPSRTSLTSSFRTPRCTGCGAATAIASVARALKRGGRFVFEMGGRGISHVARCRLPKRCARSESPNPEQLSRGRFPPSENTHR